MRNILSKSIVLFGVLFTSTLSFIACNNSSDSQGESKTKAMVEDDNSTNVDTNFHIYLCFGQSNMEGSATVEDQDTVTNPRFFAMQSMDCDNFERKMGEWYLANPILSQCYAGLSPANQFGKTMAEKTPESIKIGVINVAIGGCDIRLFDKNIYQDYDSTYVEDWFLNKIIGYGGNPYERLIDLAKIAQDNGVIKGILLHQGETNNDDENWPEYVKVIYYNILADLSLEAELVPLLAGEVAHTEQGGMLGSMNDIIDRLPEVLPTAHIISSKTSKVKDDDVHFNSDGVRELGKLYALKMIEVSK